MRYDAIVSGYVSMDHIIRIDSPASIGHTSIVLNADNTKTQYGGCGPNIAIGLCKLGKRAVPILRVGTDWETNGYRAYLEQSGVPTDSITVLQDESTSTCYLLQDNNNDHITIFYPGSMSRQHAAPVDEELVKNTRLGVITVASEPDNRYFLDACRKWNVPIVFGMRDDPDAFPPEFLKEILENSTIIFMNEDERMKTEQMFGSGFIRKLLDEKAASVVVETRGKEGSICYEKTQDGTGVHKIPVSPVREVVDATGAGDAYMTGFLYGYVDGMPVEKCCCIGAALSGYVIQASGCTTNIPSAEDLMKKAEELMKEITK